MLNYLTVVLCLSVCSLQAAKLADYVTLCSLKDPKLNQCLETQTPVLIRQLVKGVKEWNVLPIDPLFLPHMIIQQGSGSAGLLFDIKDAHLKGFKECSFSEFKFDTKTYDLIFTSVCPYLNISGDYEVSGQIILLPISGTGYARISIKNVVNQIKISLTPETRSKETYLKVTDTKVSDSSIKSMLFNLDNLFNNKALSDNMNLVLSENGKEVFTELQPSLEKSLSDIIHQIVERVFKKVPLKELFKDV